LLRTFQKAKHPVILILILLFSFSVSSFGISSNVQKTSKPAFKSFQKEKHVPEILSVFEDNENEEEESQAESPNSIFTFSPLASAFQVESGANDKSAHHSPNLWLLFANLRL